MNLTETFFVFNNKSSLDYNLAVRERASYTAAERNIEYIEIPGRNGSILRDKGTFKNVDEPISCYLFAKNRDLKNIREEASAAFDWLKSPRGWCDLYYSDDPFYFMKAHVPAAISFKEVFQLFYVGEGDIPFTRKPERYSTSGHQIRTINKSGEIIYNPESYESYPTIQIFGSGNITLYINNRAIILDNITDSITLDCEMMSSYTNINGVLVSANSKVRNTLPTLMPGENEIAWIGNVSKIEISPRWWTL
ncbi:hypothetical protein GSY37_04550 [Listeria monocytogenes]|nr:hypothetical protein [Listeria monocytogenes]